jgi:hypothetical protein
MLLGKDPSTLKSWKTITQHFTLSLFEDIAAYDVHKERDMTVWAK